MSRWNVPTSSGPARVGYAVDRMANVTRFPLPLRSSEGSHPRVERTSFQLRLSSLPGDPLSGVYHVHARFSNVSLRT